GGPRHHARDRPRSADRAGLWAGVVVRLAHVRDRERPDGQGHLLFAHRPPPPPEPAGARPRGPPTLSRAESVGRAKACFTHAKLSTRACIAPCPPFRPMQYRSAVGGHGARLTRVDRPVRVVRTLAHPTFSLRYKVSERKAVALDGLAD